MKNQSPEKNKGTKLAIAGFAYDFADLAGTILDYEKIKKRPPP